MDKTAKHIIQELREEIIQEEILKYEMHQATKTAQARQREERRQAAAEAREALKVLGRFIVFTVIGITLVLLSKLI